MAATQYMILYRLFNEDINQPITNDPSLTYNPVCEFYTQCHKLYNGSEKQKDEAYQEQQEMLLNAMNSSATNMFFVFDGAKKIRHKGVNGEEHTEDAYLIKDTYKRINGSPWLTHCVCASLEAALTKAKTLCSMIGIENVKLIKVVAYDQYLVVK